MEFDLLAFLLAHPGIVMSRERLLERVWGLSFPGGTRTVDVHVAQLRKKLDRPDLIRTVRGSGYKAVDVTRLHGPRSLRARLFVGIAATRRRLDDRDARGRRGADPPLARRGRAALARRARST